MKPQLILVLLFFHLAYGLKLSHKQLTFPPGNLYQLVCMEGNQALTPQVLTSMSRIVSAPPNANDIKQLWMIQKVGPNQDDYEIVNCASGNVMDEELGQIRLTSPKRNADQLFRVQRFMNNNYWFRTSTATDAQAIALQSILRYKKYDPNLINQIFYVIPINNSNALSNTSILISNSSGKAADTPGTSEIGGRLSTKDLIKRFNQRWRWVSTGSGFLLQNLLNNLCVDISGAAKTSGSAVVQSSKTGETNQQWVPVAVGTGVWKIKSVHAQDMFLSVQDDGNLQISDGDNPSQYWKIDGYVPKV